MPKPTTGLVLAAIAIFYGTAAIAQSPSASEIPSVKSDWQQARQAASSERKLFVITLDRPDHRQTCRVQSFTADKLVCSRAMGAPRTYPMQQVIAIILPGDGNLKLHALLILNSALGGAIWGTVVLAAPCPACAVATGITALLIFAAAGAIAIGDDQPDYLLYLAPNQHLSSKLGFIQS